MLSPDPTPKPEPKCQASGCDRPATRPVAFQQGEPSAFCNRCWERLTGLHRFDLVAAYRRAQRWDEAIEIERQIREAVQYLTQRKGAA